MSHAGDLIRQGCVLLPNQITGEWIEMEAGAACAIGAGAVAYAYEAMNDYDIRTEGITLPVNAFCRELGLLAPAVCPLGAECDCQQYVEPGVYCMLDISIHLNDHHRWTREQVAAWIDRQQDKEPVNV